MRRLRMFDSPFVAIRHSMIDLFPTVGDEHKTRDLCSGSCSSRSSNNLMNSFVR